MLAEADRRRLDLFNEKADKLLGSSFIDTMLNHPTGVKISWEAGGAVETTVTGPHSESVEAFALTLRFFRQDGREHISFRKMAELYDQAAEPDLRDEFRRLRDQLNDFLRQPTMCNVNGEQIIHERVLDVFLNGSLAHVEDKQRRAYLLWQQNPVMFGLLQNEFVTTLEVICRCVRRGQELNAALLQTG